MRILFKSLSLAAAMFLAAPAFAQDKPLPPDQPAQQDKDKDLQKKNDLDKDKDLPKDRLPDAKQPIPRDDQKDLQKDLQKDKDIPANPNRTRDLPNRSEPRPDRDAANPARPGADQPPAGRDRDRPAQPAQPRDDRGGTGARAKVETQRLSGKIVSVDNGVVVVRNDAGKEFTLNTAAQTRFLVDGRPARLADFRVGSTINGAYFMDRDRMVLDSLVIGDLPAAPPADRPVAPAPQGTLVEGTVVRVMGENQIVIKTSDGKEIIVQVSPETKYQLTQQGGAFVDVTPNLPVRVWYDVIDRRPTVRQINRWNRR